MASASLVRSLKQRIEDMQPVRLDERALPTAPALRPLFPGGALRKGASYSIHGSLHLALACLAEASRAGEWCGIVGCPDIGADAAVQAGVALDRCIIIPDTGNDALGVAGTLSEVLAVLLVEGVSLHDTRTERVAARLRENGSALLHLGDWPRAESELRVTGSRWTGLGHGHGLLHARELTVTSLDRRGPRTHLVRFENGTPAAVHGEPGRVALSAV